jgi:predicted lipoprotein with Yx(FWY)xxD motif
VNRLIHRSATTASAVLLLALSACSGSDRGGGGGSAEPGDAASSQSGTTAATTARTAKTEVGTVLVDAKGTTLYMFDPDKQGTSVCDADCLHAWPVVQGPAEAGQGVDDSLLGTADATDGTTMATYNGWPLYYFVQDDSPGDVTGQAVNGVWWVLSPEGRPIRHT